MAGINLLELKPNKVSRQLGGYITFMYGPPKIGKTTFGSKMPKPLLLAAEVGYRAIPGIIAQDITSWSQLKQVVRELKKPEVRETFDSLIFDTIDIFAEHCQKYICSQLGISAMGEGGWSNNSWSLYKKEFESVIRELTFLGYAVVFLSHDKEKTIKPQNGNEYQQIGSSMQSSALAIIENMSDLICYAHVNAENERVLTLRSLDNSVRCGSRFKYMAAEIPFSYEALENALADAIEKESAENEGKFITDDIIKPVEEVQYDYDALMKEFQDLVSQLMTKNQSNSMKIVGITDRILGTGKKVSDCTPNQAEFINLINIELKDLLK